MKSLAWALSIALAAPAAAGTLQEIRARGKLIVSVKNEGPKSPSLHKDPAHFQKRGYELELAHALAGKILGDPTKLELKLMPKATRLAAVMGDNVDLGISMFTINDERRAQVNFSVPYFVGGLAIMTRAESPITRLEDLDGKTLAMVNQTANDPTPDWKRAVAGRKVRANLVRYPTFNTAAAAVEANKADALLSHDANIRSFVEEHPGFRALPALVTREEVGVAVKQGNTELLALVDQLIGELKKSGQLEAWAKKWKLPYLL